MEVLAIPGILVGLLFGIPAMGGDVEADGVVGTWLPEPLVGYDDTDLGDVAAVRESVRTAVLLVLESLTPAERVAFVLQDVFGMDFDRLAGDASHEPP